MHDLGGALVGTSVSAFVFTYGMLWLLNEFMAVRTSEHEELELDQSLHGEVAYDQL